MRRVLHICLIAYFPLAAAVAAVFVGQFRADTLGSPLFQALFLIWVLDGFACMVLGIATIMRLVSGEESGRRTGRALVSILAVVLGAPHAYVLVELAYKLIGLLRAI